MASCAPGAYAASTNPTLCVAGKGKRATPWGSSKLGPAGARCHGTDANRDFENGVQSMLVNKLWAVLTAESCWSQLWFAIAGNGLALQCITAGCRGSLLEDGAFPCSGAGVVLTSVSSHAAADRRPLCGRRHGARHGSGTSCWRF